MPPRILVADDDQALQVLLNVILSRAGFTVDFASNGLEALEKINADSYDAVVLDLILPQVSGLEILDHLQREKPDGLRKVIILTGASRGVIEKVNGFRVHALLRKPFDIEEVIRLTAECVHAA
jgi:DNA-binding response OmpR family regulator